MFTAIAYFTRYPLIIDEPTLRTLLDSMSVVEKAALPASGTAGTSAGPVGRDSGHAPGEPGDLEQTAG